MNVGRPFTEHPASVGETYREHCGVAASFSGSLAKASLACAVHAVLPCFFKKTASRTINELHDRMHAGHRGALESVEAESTSPAVSLVS